MSIASHPPRTEPRAAVTTLSTCVVALGIALASVYGLWAALPYRGLAEATRIAARAQVVCSVLVAVVLVLMARTVTPKAHLVSLGLLAYVAYSYAMYLIGLPMTRIYLVYVVVVAVSGATLLDGLVRLRPGGWPRTTHRRLERATGWM